ncbi:hypothetical protein [Methylibium sp.]|uniref:hypothetical protein n=1 Tax=Methylibium sp. TaxID=2067992 RepID=UPI0017F2C91C|nr:hypothetical protein [Methylibium sp.]MBA3589986.1 hypothetical protein [Methylibium sp.]
MGMWRFGLADGIRKLGFRKWYERELTLGHAHLALTLVSCLGLLMALELYDRNSPMAERLSDALSLLLCAGVGLWSLRRYLFLLMHAEATANQAICPECEAYGRLEVTVEQPVEDEVLVCCRRCRHRWSILS